MGPRTTVRAPNSEKRLRGEFLDLAPPLVRISRKSVTPNATCVVHFLVQPLLTLAMTEFRSSFSEPLGRAGAVPATEDDDDDVVMDERGGRELREERETDCGSSACACMKSNVSRKRAAFCRQLGMQWNGRGISLHSCSPLPLSITLEFSV